jgi:hypothetical protein
LALALAKRGAIAHKRDEVQEIAPLRETLKDTPTSRSRTDFIGKFPLG